jgi:hypothetical protein
MSELPTFTNRLAETERAQRKEMNSRIKERITPYMRGGFDLAKNYEAQIKGLFEQQAAASRRAMTELHKLKATQAGDQLHLLEQKLENEHEVLLTSIVERIDLALDTAAGSDNADGEASDRDKISTKREMHAFMDQYFHILEGTDITSLMRTSGAADNVSSAAPGSEITITEADISQIRSTLVQAGFATTLSGLADGETPPDAMDIMATLGEDENLSFEQKEGMKIYLRDFMHQLSRIPVENASRSKDSVAISLMGLLPIPLRKSLIGELMQESMGDPSAIKDVSRLIENLVVISYLTRSQADSLLSSAIEQIEDREDEGLELTRRQRRTYEDEVQRSLSTLSQSQKTVGSEEMRRMQTQTQSATESQMKNMSQMRFGSTNYAQNLLSFKGVASFVGFATGSMGMAANILANITDPMSLPTNPALLFSAGLATASLEYSGGFSGLGPQPSKIFNSIVYKEDGEEANQARLERATQMTRKVSNDYEFAELFYNYDELIYAAWHRKDQEGGADNFKIKFSDLAIKYDDLHPDFKKKFTRAQVEEQMTEWSHALYRDLALDPGESPAGTNTKVGDFIQSSRAHYGDPPFEKKSDEEEEPS